MRLSGVWPKVRQPLPPPEASRQPSADCALQRVPTSGVGSQVSHFLKGIQEGGHSNYRRPGGG